MKRNCIINNVMHKFFIYFLIYFCLTCFRLSLSPSSRGTVYKFGSVLVQFQPGPDADTISSRLERLPNLYTVPLEDGVKESLKHVRQM
jgi:hypothetical protein